MPTYRDPANPPLVPACMPLCDERLRAIMDGRFLPSRQLKAWVWLDAPLRSVSDGVWWKAHTQPQDTHAGERYAWTTCPFCGGQLPEPDWKDCGEGEE